MFVVFCAHSCLLCSDNLLGGAIILWGEEYPWCEDVMTGHLYSSPQTAKNLDSMPRQRIMVIISAPLTAKAFLLGYLEALGRRYDVTLVCSDAKRELEPFLPPGVSLLPVNIQRAISPIQDVRALFELIRIIRKGEFSMVHSVTPKAGLLGQLSAWWCGVDIRVHTFTGQVWVTQHGFFRQLLKAMDQLIAFCASRLLADSVSQRDFLVAEGIVARDKIEVLGAGSISGVNVARFRPDLKIRQDIRARFGFVEDDVLALFVGRLNRDKGVLDLVRAFALVSERLPKLALLLVGPDEDGLAPEIERLCPNNSRLILLGSTPRPEDYMAASDFFCLPSYREGFGSVVIEAAACGIPAMASAIYGLTDAVENGRSGALHPPRDVQAIVTLLERFATDWEWRGLLGEYALNRAQTIFSSEAVINAQMDFVGRQMSLKISMSATS